MADLPETSTITVSGKVYSIKDADGRTLLNNKQDKLTAGKGITINENGVISADVGGIEQFNSLPKASADYLNKFIKVGKDFFVGKERKYNFFAWKMNYELDESLTVTVYTTTPNPKVGDCVYNVLNYYYDNDYYDMDNSESDGVHIEHMIVDNTIVTIDDVKDNSIVISRYLEKNYGSFVSCEYTRAEEFDTFITGERRIYSEKGTYKAYVQENSYCKMVVLKDTDSVGTYVKSSDGEYDGSGEVAPITEFSEDSLTIEFHCSTDTFRREPRYDVIIDPKSEYYFQNINDFEEEYVIFDVFENWYSHSGGGTSYTISSNTNNILKMGLYEFVSNTYSGTDGGFYYGMTYSVFNNTRHPFWTEWNEYFMIYENLNIDTLVNRELEINGKPRGANETDNYHLTSYHMVLRRVKELGKGLGFTSTQKYIKYNKSSE